MMLVTRERLRLAMALVMRSGFPWSSAPTNRDERLETRFRRRARRALLARWPRAARFPAMAAMTVAWPIHSLWEAIDCARNALPGPLGGRSRARLALSAWGRAVRSNVPPVEYFAFRLFDRRAGPVDSWVIAGELGAVNRALLGRPAAELVHDKLAFAGFCGEIGVGAVPILACYAGGAVARPFEKGEPPARDLVIKPRRGARATGLEAWFYREGRYHSAPHGGPAEDTALDASGLGARARALSVAGGEILVQPMLRAHPALAALAPVGVPVLRVITGAWPDGRVAVIAAMINRSPAGSIIAGGYRHALVDPETGRVRDEAPGQRAPIYARYALDPLFRGLVIPDWDACREVVLRLHAAFPRPAPLIGWDIAPTSEGPVPLEANASLSLFEFQVASLEPALRGPLRALLQAWL